MFCPKCGQQNSDAVRFCTRCGFRLVTVKQLLSEDGLPEKDHVEASANPLQLGRKNLNLGALLMYVGSLFALFVGVFYGGAHKGDSLDAFFALPSAIMWGFLTNAVVFAGLLVGIRFSKRQKDLGLGATLMFLLSLLANFAIPALELGGVNSVESFGKAGLVALTASFVTVLFLGRPLMQWMLRGLFNLFAEEGSIQMPVATLANGQQGNAALPPMQSVVAAPAPAIGVTTRQMVPTESVTEEATRMLEEGQ